MPALMRSELPEIIRTRHHWIVLVTPPEKPAALALLALLVLAVFWPWPFALILIATITTMMVFRVQTWLAEVIILTTKRIIRSQGVPETTSSEASLRVDRVSGIRLVQTVPGKILGYGTIDLEAPGNHPEVRRLRRIAAPQRFYAELRALIFKDDAPADPDTGANSTQPIPFIPYDPAHDHHRRDHEHSDDADEDAPDDDPD